jgi:hypothetical protein
MTGIPVTRARAQQLESERRAILSAGVRSIRPATKAKLFRIAMYRLLKLGLPQAERDYGWSAGSAQNLVGRYSELVREYEMRCYRLCMDRMRQDHVELMQEILICGKRATEELAAYLKGDVELEREKVAVHKEFLRLAKDLMPADFEAGGSVEDVRELTPVEEAFEGAAQRWVQDEVLPERAVPEPEN